MAIFNEIVSDREAMLSLEPEELAGYLLIELIQQIKQRSRPSFDGFPRGYQAHGEAVCDAIAEALSWLEREGCLVRDWRWSGDTVLMVTRRGRELAKSFNGDTPIGGELLIKNILHPAIKQRAWSQFIRGEFDSAIFQSMLQVEIFVRKAANLPRDLVGKDLMRKAFDLKNGPLTNKNGVAAEEEAIAHLFAGAIGYFRNSSGHRDVAASQNEAIEVLTFASHLMRIVELRSPLQAQEHKAGE